MRLGLPPGGRKVAAPRHMHNPINSEKDLDYHEWTAVLLSSASGMSTRLRGFRYGHGTTWSPLARCARAAG
jgi:hypothetical protein